MFYSSHIRSQTKKTTKQEKENNQLLNNDLSFVIIEKRLSTILQMIFIEKILILSEETENLYDNNQKIL